MTTTRTRTRRSYNYSAGRARTFGDGSTEARVAARHAELYGANPGQAILEAQQEADRKRSTRRQEAAVNSTDRATRQTVERMVALAAERTPNVTEAQIFQFAATNSADVVHARLRWLEAQPVVKGNESEELPQRRTAPATRVEVPAGRYAATGEDGATKFYRVDRPTEGRWAGYTFVKVQAGDELHPVKGRQAREAILAKIAAAGVQEAMLRYGREIGECGHCGRTLTNPESREAGIGPVCRNKMGW